MHCCKNCYPEGCAAPGVVPCQCNTRGSLSKLKGAPPQRKINVTCKSPVGDISVVTLIRTDTTLDHSQKAEKVCGINADAYEPHTGKPHMCWLCGGQARSEHALCPWALANRICIVSVGTRRFRKHWRSHIDASHSRQPLIKRRKISAL